MILCITEKPSVGRDLARILGATRSMGGYMEGNGYYVSWTFGHLCSLKDPADYNPGWKPWALSRLPMIPDKFGIKVMDDPGIQKQFNVIKELIGRSDEIINCGDAGQEGEVIQRWVMQKAGCDKPVRRLWVSSLTDEAVREGFSKLRDGSELDSLYTAGICRAIGDWILGINATRLYTLRYGVDRQILSIGRVQTPTLALVVQRQKDIENFVPSDTWELKTKYRDVIFSATVKPFDDKEKGEALLNEVKQYPLVIGDITHKKGKEAPPRLFDLTSLQVESNKKYSMGADQTLRAIQSLYEKKLTTYPRVDTTYLSEDLYPKVPDILRRMTPYASLTAPVLAARLPKSKKVFDNAKVTDHHAIIPTGQSPTVLVGDEKKLYHLIARRFIAAFYPDCIFNSTTVMAKAAEVEFKATGKVITDPGWRSVYASDAKDAPADGGDDAENAAMPEMAVGEHGPHEPSLLKKATQPPKPYTEGSLLRAMEGAGRTVEDEELREAMKENGIGRPSTRASIIETLFKRKYIYRQRKSILPSQAGIDLIATINEPLLKSAKLTGLWESKLRRIERGDYAPADFIAELKQMVNQTVINVLSDNSGRTIATAPDKADEPKATSSDKAAKPRKPSAPRVRKLEDIKCPLCGEGHILKGRTAYGCSRYAQGCPLRLPFDTYSADLTPGRLAAAIRKNPPK